MSKSAIEWTEDTWNPIVGCSILSPGCANCYAMKMAARIEAMNAEARPGHGSAPQYDGTTTKVNGSAVWTGKLAMAGDNILLQPLKRKKPTTYFVNSMGDLFHEDCPDEWIDRVFAVMALCQQHTFQVLTKRAARMRHYQCDPQTPDRQARVNAQIVAGFDSTACERLGVTWNTLKAWPLPNVWLGVSTERQQEADERIPELLRTPAAVRFISAEPLLGPINLTSINHRGVVGGHSALHDRGLGQIDWVIVGGESGPDARAMHPYWARSLRDQCAAAGVPFFFKQWGNWKPDELEGSAISGNVVAWPDGALGRGDAGDHGGRGTIMFNVGKSRAGKSLDGLEHKAMPAIHSGDHHITPPKNRAATGSGVAP